MGICNPIINFCCCCCCSTERLINGIVDIKKALAYKCGRPHENTDEANVQIDKVATQSTSKCIRIVIWLIMFFEMLGLT